MMLGIALGVAVVIAIDLANTSARTAFDLSTETVVGRATHQIQGGPSGVPDAFYRQLRADWGYRLSAPVVEGVVVALDLDKQPLQLLGVDPLSEAPFRSYLSGGGSTLGSLAQLMAALGEEADRAEGQVALADTAAAEAKVDTAVGRLRVAMEDAITPGRLEQQYDEQMVALRKACQPRKHHYTLTRK